MQQHLEHPHCGLSHHLLPCEEQRSHKHSQQGQRMKSSEGSFPPPDTSGAFTLLMSGLHDSTADPQNTDRNTTPYCNTLTSPTRAIMKRGRASSIKHAAMAQRKSNRRNPASADDHYTPLLCQLIKLKGIPTLRSKDLLCLCFAINCSHVFERLTWSKMMAILFGSQAKAF